MENTQITVLITEEETQQGTLTVSKQCFPRVYKRHAHRTKNIIISHISPSSGQKLVHICQCQGGLTGRFSEQPKAKHSTLTPERWVLTKLCRIQMRRSGTFFVQSLLVIWIWRKQLELLRWTAPSWDQDEHISLSSFLHVIFIAHFIAQMTIMLPLLLS